MRSMIEVLRERRLQEMQEMLEKYQSQIETLEEIPPIPGNRYDRNLELRALYVQRDKFIRRINHLID